MVKYSLFADRRHRAIWLAGGPIEASNWIW